MKKSILVTLTLSLFPSLAPAQSTSENPTETPPNVPGDSPAVHATSSTPDEPVSLFLHKALLSDVVGTLTKKSGVLASSPRSDFCVLQHERQQSVLPDIPAYEISSGNETKKLVLDTLAEFYNLGKIHTSYYIRMDPKTWRDDLFNKEISYLTATFIFGDASSRMDGVGSYYRVSNVSEYALSFTRQKDILCITTKKL